MYPFTLLIILILELPDSGLCGTCLQYSQPRAIDPSLWNISLYKVSSKLILGSPFSAPNIIYDTWRNLVPQIRIHFSMSEINLIAYFQNLKLPQVIDLTRLVKCVSRHPS